MGQPVDRDEASVTRPLSRKRRQTQARLLDAALDAFAERGFYGTSVEDVCERAGFTRGAFYSNFSSKEELFVALYARQADHVLATLTDLAPAAGDSLESALAELVAAIPMDRRWFLVNTEFALHAVRDPGAAAAYAAARARVRASLAARFAQLAERFGEELTVPLDDLVRWLFAVRDGAVAQSYVERDGVDDITARVIPLLVTAVSGAQRVRR